MFILLLFSVLCGVIFKSVLKSILGIVSAAGCRKKTQTLQYSSHKNYYWAACGTASYKTGSVFPSGTNRPLACSVLAQDIRVCVEQVSGLQQVLGRYIK